MRRGQVGECFRRRQACVCLRGLPGVEGAGAKGVAKEVAHACEEGSFTVTQVARRRLDPRLVPAPTQDREKEKVNEKENVKRKVNERGKRRKR